MSDASLHVSMPERPSGYADAAAQDPPFPTTSEESATRTQSSGTHAYGDAPSHCVVGGESQVTPRLTQSESLSYAQPREDFHSATRSEDPTTSDPTPSRAVYDPMHVDQGSDDSLVTPRPPPIGQDSPPVIGATDPLGSTELRTLHTVLDLPATAAIHCRRAALNLPGRRGSH